MAGCIDNDLWRLYATFSPSLALPTVDVHQVRGTAMAQYQQRFGDCDIRFDLTAEHGSHAARLFFVTPQGLSPLLNEQAQPVVISATTAALAYLAAVQYLTERFGPAT